MVEDIGAVRNYAFTCQDDWEEKLFTQCYCKVLNVDNAFYRLAGSIILVELSKPQYLELKITYKHYCEQWQIELKMLWLAFINYHDLFAPDTPTIDLPSENVELLAKIMQQIEATK